MPRGMPKWWMEGELLVEASDERRTFTPGRKCFRTGNALRVCKGLELLFFCFLLFSVDMALLIA
jgi:hypothetical protein